MILYRLTVTDDIFSRNKLYDHLEDKAVKSNVLFFTTKESLDNWKCLFKEENKIAILYTWKAVVLAQPIKKFVYKNKKYEETELEDWQVRNYKLIETEILKGD